MNRLHRLLTLQFLLTILSLVQAQTRAYSVQQYHLNFNAFLWDESCTDWPNPNAEYAVLGETKQDAVATAFEGALELAADAWNRFNSTAQSLNDSASQNDDANNPNIGPSDLTQLLIDESDPA